MSREEEAGEHVLEPSGEHTHTLVLLHGMYCRPDDLIPVAEKFADLAIPAQGVRILLPYSPVRDISWPRRTEWDVFSWYNYFTDKSGKGEHDDIDVRHLESQAKRLCGILSREADLLGDDTTKLILGGNSQGGTVACHVAMMFGRPLGALICLRTVLMDVTPIKPEANTMPVFVFCAERDGIYIRALAVRSYQRLVDAGYQVEWHIEPRLLHVSSSEAELSYAAKWAGLTWFGQQVQVTTRDVPYAKYLPSRITDLIQLAGCALFGARCWLIGR